MALTKWIVYPCKISPGAFSGERLIRVKLAQQELEFVSPIQYVLKEAATSSPLAYSDQETREGWVRAKLVDEREGEYVALLPVDRAANLPKSQAKIVTVM